MYVSHRSSHLKAGLIAFVWLAVLSIGEFAIAAVLPHGNVLPLTVIAIAKAVVIARTFMHFAQIWRSEESHE